MMLAQRRHAVSVIILYSWNIRLLTLFNYPKKNEWNGFWSSVKKDLHVPGYVLSSYIDVSLYLFQIDGWLSASIVLVHDDYLINEN